MAKTSVVVRNNNRLKLAKQYREKREGLKKIIKNLNASPEERINAMWALEKLPRDSSKVRHRNRCFLTGRGRGILSRFGLCRNEFRRLSHMGQIVGVTKSSW